VLAWLQLKRQWEAAMQRIRSGLLAGAVLALLAIAPASAKPADCSTAAAPATPVKGTVGGKDFTPTQVSVQIGKGFAVNDVKFDSYDLSFQVGDSIFNALNVRVIVKEGTRADGRTFRMLATDDMGAQPMAIEGTPEVQSWDLQYGPANVDTSFTQEPASMRLEYGQRKGNMLPGKISFCVPGQRASIGGTFSAKIGR
jgi:hypothetical protein